MPTGTDPYLRILRAQLESSLVPRDENARKVPLYSHRILSVLLAETTERPGLQQKALAELAGLLDELCAALGGIDGGLILLPQLHSHIRYRPDYAAAEPCVQTAVRLLGQNPDAAGLRLQQQIAGITSRMQAAFHQSVRAQDMRPVADASPAASLDAAQTLALRNYLRSKYPNDAALDIGNMKTIIGGGSKRTVVVELNNTHELPDAVVLRIDLSHSIVGSTVADEFRLIELVHEAGLPVPKPYLLESDIAVLGHPFIVVSRVEGRNIGDWFEITEPSRAFAIGLAQALAKLHKIAPERAGALPGSTLGNREIVEKEILHHEAIWRASGEPSIAMEQGIGWLKRHIEYGVGKRAIIHRDVGCHNMLGRDGDLAALLDWETAGIGNPAHDLMYARVAVLQMMPWDEFLVEYEKAGGVIPSAKEVLFYRLLTAVYGMHFCLLSRKFLSTGLSETMMLSYAAQCIHLYYQTALHEAVELALASEG